jgi:hypothetical protein
MTPFRRTQLGYLIMIFLVIAVARIVAAPSSLDAPQEPATVTARSAEAASPQSYIAKLRAAAGDLAAGISPAQYAAAARLIRAEGYDCQHADLMIRWAFHEGYSVYCRQGRYIFELANHGGRWTVAPP